MLSALDCAVDGADVTDAERFAGEEETVGDWFGIDNLRAGKPERVHERKTDNFVPLFAKVPELKIRMPFSEVDPVSSTDSRERRIGASSSGVPSFAELDSARTCRSRRAP